MSDLEERARVLGRSVKRHKSGYDRGLDELRKVLPELRASDPDKWGPKDLEELLEGALDRGTISRWTAAAAGTSRKQDA